MARDDRGLPDWLDVSRETRDRLETYADLVRKWTPRINLVSGSTVGDIWNRHILDSAQIVGLAPAKWKTWTDLGSGAGFPGLVVAILAADTGKTVSLIESDERKAAFLRVVAIELKLDVAVHAVRIEKADPQSADVVSARALAPLPTLIELAVRHLAPGGICLFTKGVRADHELTEARGSWNMQVERCPSRTDPGGTILKIGAISRV